ncbi:MAG TPA: type II secretion system protein GspL, partial [Dokdonella sp.]
MSDRLLLRLAADGALTWLRQAGAAASASNVGAPPSSALAAAGEVVVFVPSEDVWLGETRLAARSRAQLAQALPFAVEDQLLGTLEELHFAAARGDGDHVGVAVVAKERMRAWLARLAEAGVRADVLVPESLALPLAPGRAGALIEDARAVVRLAPWSAFACMPAELPSWLAQAEAGGALAPLDVQDFRDAPALALPVEVASYRERQCDPLAALAAAWSAPQRAPAANLLDGEFAPAHGAARGARAWRRAGALAAAVALLALLNLGADVL